MFESILEDWRGHSCTGRPGDRGKRTRSIRRTVQFSAETHWGDVTLPAGDYTLSLPSPSFPYALYIHGKTAGAIFTAITVDEAVVSRSPRLDLVNVTANHAVQKFEAPGLGMTFAYCKPKQKGLGSKAARQKAVPQPACALASQITEDKTFVEVRTAGR
jgi:hypothetical protein